VLVMLTAAGGPCSDAHEGWQNIVTKFFLRRMSVGKADESLVPYKQRDAT
jgi:hypothetical protein